VVKMKKGFSLLELIVAIVIIGLTMVALPKIFSTVSDNNKMAVIQETVMDAKTRLAIISTASWSCTGDANYERLSTPIFGGLNNFYTTNGIPQEGRRIFSNIARTGVACAAWENSTRDLASFNNITTQIRSTAGYDRDSIITADLVSSIGLSEDMSGGNNPDIRRIGVTATTQNTAGQGAGHTITLRAYSANIGTSPDIYTRSW
jgi:prepilin-type N-cleavage/methylation domain protein